MHTHVHTHTHTSAEGPEKTAAAHAEERGEASGAAGRDDWRAGYCCIHVHSY